MIFQSHQLNTMAVEEENKALDQTEYIIESFTRLKPGMFMEKDHLKELICSNIVFKQRIKSKLQYTAARNLEVWWLSLFYHACIISM